MKILISMIVAVASFSQPVFAADVCGTLKQVLLGNTFNTKFFYHNGASDTEVMTFSTDANGKTTLKQSAAGQSTTLPISFLPVTLHDKPSCQLVLDDGNTTFSSTTIDAAGKSVDFVSNQDFIDWVSLRQN